LEKGKKGPAALVVTGKETGIITERDEEK